MEATLLKTLRKVRKRLDEPPFQAELGMTEEIVDALRQLGDLRMLYAFDELYAAAQEKRETIRRLVDDVLNTLMSERQEQ